MKVIDTWVNEKNKDKTFVRTKPKKKQVKTSVKFLPFELSGTIYEDRNATSAERYTAHT